MSKEAILLKIKHWIPGDHQNWQYLNKNLLKKPVGATPPSISEEIELTLSKVSADKIASCKSDNLLLKIYFYAYQEAYL